MRDEVDKFVSVYDWKGAASACERFLKRSEEENHGISELLADCLYNSAFQQESRDGFRREILKAREAYFKIKDDRCRARAFFCDFWYSDDPDKRREVIGSECLPIARQLVKHLESTSEIDETSVARGYVELFEYLTVACLMSVDGKQLSELVKDAKTTGRKMFHGFKNSNDPKTVILVSNPYVAFLDFAIGNFIDPEETRQIKHDIVPFIDTLLKLAESIEDSRIRSLAYEAAGMISSGFKGDFQRAASLYEKSISESEKTRDKHIEGRHFLLLGYWIEWASFTNDIVDERRQLRARAIQYQLRAIESLEVLLASELELSYCYYVNAAFRSAKESIDIPEKLRYLNNAIELGRNALQYVSFCPLNAVESGLAGALTGEAELAASKDDREKLLSEAVNLTRNQLSRFEALTGRNSWNVASCYMRLGVDKAKLANEKTEQERESLLRESVSDLKKTVEICTKIKQAIADPAGRAWRIGEAYEKLGESLANLYYLSRRRDDCLNSIESLSQATEYYTQASLAGYVGPITWKIATLYDSISEYSKSSAAFARAARQYQTVSANQKSLHKSFADLSLYMQSWSMIEAARLSHSNEKYEIASEKLKQVADALSKSESFRYLTKHYRAFSMMEQAEESSRKESNIEASRIFGQAHDLFQQAQKDIQALVDDGTLDENESKEWVALSETRAKYCLARRELDEAKVLDKNAESKESMSKYRSASEALRNLREGMPGQDALELDAVALSCDAWAMMKEAEIKSSPDLYSKASEIFLKAKENNLKQSFVLSCLANAAVCRAFEAGTTFKETKDIRLYSQIKKHLGTASQYYEEAGYEIASDWTRATEALFDALAFLAQGEVELDPQKKTQLYHLAETHLEVSARRYGDIGYDRKSQEVLRYLKLARENREMLVTPLEALSENPTISPTPISFNSDRAVGLERFEVANISGSLTVVPEQPVNLGSRIQLEIEVANIGKTAALLLKLRKLADSNVFELEASGENNESRESCDDEREEREFSIDLKGKRLEYLKSHQMIIFLKAKAEGSFELKPEVIFVDELGKYRSYQFDTQIIEVKKFDLGDDSISQMQSVPRGPKIEFKSSLTAKLFDQLVDCFIQDHLLNHFAAERSGWRTLSEIARGTGTSPSRLYGRQGGVGPPLSEPIRNGLIQVRIFPGERGRGGEIMKLRVVYETPIVRKYVKERNSIQRSA